MKKLSLFLLISSLLFFSFGCSPNYVSVPPGYIGKVLTPKGYSEEIHEAGQVDIGTTDSNGMQNTLVICEASTVTIKESFDKSTEGDHRISTRNPKKSPPLSVDVRVQVALPFGDDAKAQREAIFAMVTPQKSTTERVSFIELSQVYTSSAAGTVRNRIREIFSRCEDYDDVMSRYSQINSEISKAIAGAFKENHTPLVLLSAELSNVKPDEAVTAAQNQFAASQSEIDQINAVGKAIQANPGYLEMKKWEVIREAAGKGATIIIDASDKGRMTTTLPLK